MNAKTLCRVLALLAVLMIAGSVSAGLRAQIGGGSIEGTITDPGGALVPGATVVATNVATGVQTTKQTNAAGLYVISPLPPGTYKVVVSATGFQTLIQENVVVDALSTVAVNLTLKVGNVNEAITVTDAPAQLNTSDPRLGSTIRNEL